MYQKYQTDALVVASFDVGEADKAFSFVTRDFGLVRARASAVRHEKSLMRYALQNYAFANISLVRGKRGWRVAGARARDSLPVIGNTTAIAAFARISELVTRLIAGEEKNEYLFETLLNAHNELRANTRPETIEILCVARVLFALGYLSAADLGPELFVRSDFGPSDIEIAASMKGKIIAAINHALSETQLMR